MLAKKCDQLKFLAITASYNTTTDPTVAERLKTFAKQVLRRAPITDVNIQGFIVNPLHGQEILHSINSNSLMKNSLSYLDLSENSWWWTDDNGNDIAKNTTLICNILTNIKSLRMILLYDNLMSGN